MGNPSESRKRRKGGPTNFQRKRKVRNKKKPEDIGDIGDGNNAVAAPTTTSVTDDTPSCLVVESASAKKLRSGVDPVALDCCDSTSENPYHFLIIDSEILQTIIDVIGKCPKCKENGLVLSNKVSQKKGLANLLQIDCSSSDCDFVYSTYSSKIINHQSTPGQNPFDVNARAILGLKEIGKGFREIGKGFREIGKGHTAMEQLFGLMNFLPVTGKDSFQQMNDDIAASYSKVAKQCMIEAANELHPDPEDKN